MTFEQVMDEMSALVGERISIALGLTCFGPADGWLADKHGKVARIDRFIEGMDHPVHYVRFEDGSGFALYRDRFKEAIWKTIANDQSLEIDMGEISVSISRIPS